MVEIHVRIEREALYDLGTDELRYVFEAPHFAAVLATEPDELTLLFRDHGQEAEQAESRARDYVRTVGLEPLSLSARAA